MKNHILKLMVFTMSFFILSTAVAAKKEASQREVQKHALGIGLGQTFLLGNFDKKGDDKITLDFIYTYTASYSFDLLINLHSSSHAYNGKEVDLLGLAMGIKARYFEFDAFSPYVLGGLGFYQPRVTQNGVQSESKTTFGINFGAGLDLRLNDEFVVGLMGQFHNPFKVDQEDPTISDVRGSYFKLMMTLLYQF